MSKTIYYMTEGEYSDYSIVGIYEGPEGVDLEALAKEYINKKAGKMSPNKYRETVIDLDTTDFQNFVREKSGLVEVSAAQLWIGSYGKFEVEQ